MSFWIMRPFGPLFYISMIFFIGLLALASLLVKGKSDRTKAMVISVVCWVTLVGFFVYKYALSIDPEYDVLTANMGGFNWWGELPLHLCNINLLLIPIAAFSKKRALLSFCFFIGPLGALMALLMPGNGFDGFSIFLPRMLGYYGTHFIVMIAALALGTFGLYHPKMRDVPMIAATLFIVALIIFGINMILRTTGLHPKANYFYTVETEGNPLLEIFWRWLPVPFLYMLPCIAVLCAYAALIMSGFTVRDAIREKRNRAEASIQ